MLIPSFEDYLTSLTNLTVAADPTVLTAEAAQIAAAAKAMATTEPLTRETLAALIREHPDYVPALGYAAGLSREALKNALKHHLGTSGWVNLARESPNQIVKMLDDEYNLVSLVDAQRRKTYDFGDLLVARAGPRATASSAGQRGRRIEDEIERVAKSLRLECKQRTRFQGRGSKTAPCDLAIPRGGAGALIVVAAKGFNSTGSKLSDAVREVEAMASVRKPTQFVMAVIDGIGWKNRRADLKRLYDLWAADSIDGMYTLSTLDRFRIDLEANAKRVGLL